MNWLIITVAVLLLLSILCKYLERAQCPNCKSRKVAEIGREEIGSEPKLFKETVRLKEYNNKGNHRTDWGHRAASNQYVNPPTKIITKEVIVEGKRTWYNVGYRCKKCNNEFLVKEYIDTKPEIEE